MCAMSYPHFPFMGRCVLEAGDTDSRRLLHILDGSGKGKMTNARIVSGLSCVMLA